MKNSLKVIISFFCFAISSLIIIILIVKWENNNMITVDNWVDYEVRIFNSHDVMLYKSDLTDSIELRLEDAYNLVGEQMIQVNHPTKKFK